MEKQRTALPIPRYGRGGDRRHRKTEDLFSGTRQAWANLRYAGGSPSGAERRRRRGGRLCGAPRQAGYTGAAGRAGGPLMQGGGLPGIRLREFDLDGALARRPQLILVDELAHSNAPGCRHTKRYQDVEELLQAGDQCLYHSKRAAPGISERSCHLHHRDRGERTDPGSRV